MASSMTFKLFGGPSKLELMLSLFDKRPLDITEVRSSEHAKRDVIFETKIAGRHVAILVEVIGVEESSSIDKGSNDWLVTGYALRSNRGTAERQKVRFPYNTQSREGVMTVEPTGSFVEG